MHHFRKQTYIHRYMAHIGLGITEKLPVRNTRLPREYALRINRLLSGNCNNCFQISKMVAGPSHHETISEMNTRCLNAGVFSIAATLLISTRLSWKAFTKKV